LDSTTTLPWQIDPSSMLAAILCELRNQQPLSRIAHSFHYWVASMMVEVATRLRKTTSFRVVGLTGGTFQNRLLCSQARHLLEQAGFTVWTHKRIPCNDGGISVGQILLADKYPHLVDSVREGR
jgi:hydrogenase maturation protein HypF